MWLSLGCDITGNFKCFLITYCFPMFYNKNAILILFQKITEKAKHIPPDFRGCLNAFTYCLFLLFSLENYGNFSCSKAGPHCTLWAFSAPVWSCDSVLASSVGNNLLPSSFLVNLYELNVIKSSKTMETSLQHVGSLPVEPVCYFHLITDLKIQLDSLKKGSPN